MPLLLALLGVLGLVVSSPRPAAGAPLPPGPPAPSLLAGGGKFLEGLHREMQIFVLEVARRALEQGIKIKLTSGIRSCAQQNAIYAQGRTTAGPIVTGAKGCRSWHVQGRAVDFEPSPRTPQAYAAVGAIAEGLGGVWGGRFSNLQDLGHIEYHPGLKIEDVCPNPEACA